MGNDMNIYTLHHFSARGISLKNKLISVEIRRGPQVMLKFSLNAYGGSVMYSAPAGAQIVFPNDLPTVTSPRDAAWDMTVSDNAGTFYHLTDQDSNKYDRYYKQVITELVHI
jgi:hypothetical protein